MTRWGFRTLATASLIGCGGAVGRSPFWPTLKPIPDSLACATWTEAPIRRRLKAFATLDHDGMAKGVVAGDVTTGQAKDENQPALRALARCYDDALGRDPHAKGALVLRYAIPAGSGPDVCLWSTTVRDGEFATCVVSALRPLASEWFALEKTAVAASIQLARGEEEGTRWWYGPGQRWDGDQAPRMKDVPSDPATGPGR